VETRYKLPNVNPLRKSSRWSRKWPESNRDLRSQMRIEQNRAKAEIFKKIRNIAGEILGKEIRFRKELNKIHVKLKLKKST
jgi:hypothetical protein